MRDEGVYKCIEELTQAACALLSAKLRVPEDIPTRVKEIIEFHGTSMGTRHENAFDWAWIVTRYWDDLIALKEFRNAGKCLRTNPEIAKHIDQQVGVSGTRSHLSDDDVLSAMLERYFEEQEDVSFNPQALATAYEKVESYFYTYDLQCRAIAPLYSFRTDAIRIDLEPGLRIEKLSAEERGNILTEAREVGAIFSHRAVGFAEYAIVWNGTVPKLFGELPQGEKPVDENIRLTFDAVCSALRLFKAGRVGYQYLLYEYPTQDRPLGTFHVEAIAPNKHFWPGYWLANAEARAFIEFWRNYKNWISRKKPECRLAIRRINLGHHRQDEEDRIIDYMVGLEALLLADKQELGYKLALRGGFLLGETPERRIQIFRELKAAYNARSTVAHGNQLTKTVNVGNESICLEKLGDRVEDHLRAAIKQELARDPRVKLRSFLSDVDEKIVAGSSNN